MNKWEGIKLNGVQASPLVHEVFFLYVFLDFKFDYHECDFQSSIKLRGARHG